MQPKAYICTYCAQERVGFGVAVGGFLTVARSQEEAIGRALMTAKKVFPEVSYHNYHVGAYEQIFPIKQDGYQATLRIDALRG